MMLPSFSILRTLRCLNLKRLPSNLRGFTRYKHSTSFHLGSRGITILVGSGVGISAHLLLASSRGPKCKAAEVSVKRIKRADTFDAELEEKKLSWKELFVVLGPEWLRIIMAVMSAFAVAILNIQIPLYLGDIVNVLSKFANEGGENQYLRDMVTPAKKLLFAYLAQGAGTFFYISTLSAMGERVAARLRRRLFEAVIAQEMEFYDRTRSGELLDRLTSDVQDFKSSFKLCISQGLRSATQTVGSIGALYTLSPKLTGLMVIVVPGMVSIGTIIGSGLRFLSRSAQAQTAKATAVADEAIVNIRTVKAFAMEEQEMSLFHTEMDLAAKLYQRLGVGIAAFQALSNVALNGIVLGVLGVGGLLMSRSELLPGDLMSFLVATQTIQRSLAQLSLLYGQAIRGYSAGARVMEYISLVPPEAVHHSQDTLPALRPSVAFENITFRYPSRTEQDVISNFSLNIKEGSVIAICGPSGAGKSTLVALLERFYDPDVGRICIGNRDLRSLNRHFLRRRLLGLISQEPQLFHTSVRENIRYGRPEASDEEVEAAARLANAYDFVSTFPCGFDTIVGERGTAVSGGQKQRIAIARALIKDPAILILDEATSALDTESERLVQDALDRVMKNRTVIVIAHRLSTIRNADMIVVMARGKVIEKGNHSQLMKNRGMYYRLVEGQEFD